jgi:hypothetical protein
MLEICISGFLVISATFGILLWPALIVARQADSRLREINDLYSFEPAEEKVQLTRPTASAPE